MRGSRAQYCKEERPLRHRSQEAGRHGTNRGATTSMKLMLTHDGAFVARVVLILTAFVSAWALVALFLFLGWNMMLGVLAGLMLPSLGLFGGLVWVENHTDYERW